MSNPVESKPERAASWLALAIIAALTAGAAAFGSTFGPGPWYESLTKPSWNPPNWIFPLVWTPLYVMIALAGWRLYHGGPRSAPFAWWCVQLVLNAAWSWLFFGRQLVGGALIDLAALWIAIGATIATALPRGGGAAHALLGVGHVCRDPELRALAPQLEPPHLTATEQ
jgi:benzodiazapine receptor